MTTDFEQTRHYQAHLRIIEGIEQRLIKLCDKQTVTPEFVLEGMWDWFRTEHPEAHAKFKAAEDRIDALWLEGRTDSETLNEFNAQLRIYRDGVYWIMEKHVNWKKELEAAARAKDAQAGKQEALVMR